MTKVTVLLFIAVILPALYGYPLEDNSEISTSVPTSDTKPHDLKVHPLVTRETELQKSDNAFNETTTEVGGDDSTEQTYIEETYIEVLLPGVPQVNSSVLESLLNASASNNTSEGNRSKRDLAANQEVSTSTITSTTAQLPVSSTQESKKDSTEGKLPSFTTAQDSTVAPVLYSEHNTEKVKREADSSTDASTETSPEEKTGKPPAVAGLLSTQSNASQSSNTRVVRDTTVAEEKSNLNTNAHPQVLATSGSSTPVTSSSPKPGLITEAVVFVTPQAKKLDLAQNPPAAKI